MYGKSADKFLSLIPECCRLNTMQSVEQEEDGAFWARGELKKVFSLRECRDSSSGSHVLMCTSAALEPHKELIDVHNILKSGNYKETFILSRLIACLWSSKIHC